MPTIYIDKQPYEIREGQNLLQACLELGLNLPYFCWHPAMGSVGACRQCAVLQFKDENDTKGRLVMACMTPANDKTYLSIFNPQAVEFREAITEWMMVNHPHDCPVCDEGGECHLQDMTVMTGHDYRRYRGNKRTFYNQYLGPFINHEMNRCIQCYRCVRFYRDYAGGRDFNVFALHDTVYFGRDKDGILESEFSGNLVEVCPTGVFTDKTLKKHYTRKWDLQTAPSICVNCSVGCNTIPGERYKLLRRIRARYNGDVNGYFICDRGRYGYEFVNSQRRIRHPRVAGGASAADPKEVISLLQGILANSSGVIGIGSPRASLESNFALRTLVGPEHFFQGISEQQHSLTSQAIDILQNGPARSASLHDIAQADAVLVLGEDVSNTAPMMALALRQSVRQKPIKKAANTLHIPVWDDYPMRVATEGEQGPLFIASVGSTRIDGIASATYRAAPDDIARLGFAVAHEIDPDAPEVTGLDDSQQQLAVTIAQQLRDAERPMVISGTSLGSMAVIQAAANVSRALIKTGRSASLSYAFPECNSLGLGLMGGASLAAAVEAVKSGAVDTLIILENDLYRHAMPSVIDELFRAVKNVVVLDYLENQTVERATIIIPAATFAETDGAQVNNEGRVQRYYQVFVPDVMVAGSWQWIRDVLAALNRPEGAGWQSLDDLQADLAKAIPLFQPLLEVAPPSGFRIVGEKIPREPARYSGRTAISANISVHEPSPVPDTNTPLDFSMEGTKLQPPPALIPRFWAPGWNSIQALNKFQNEIAGPLRGGNPGFRLIEPGGNQPAYFADVPSVNVVQPGEWQVVPLYHVFGSEELSMLTPGVAERAPQPYLALNSADVVGFTSAVRTGIKSPGEAQELTVELEILNTVYRLPVQPSAEIPRGLIGLPVGLPGLTGIPLPAVGHILPGSATEGEAKISE